MNSFLKGDDENDCKDKKRIMLSSIVSWMIVKNQDSAKSKKLVDYSIT